VVRQNATLSVPAFSVPSVLAPVPAKAAMSDNSVDERSTIKRIHAQQTCKLQSEYAFSDYYKYMYIHVTVRSANTATSMTI